MKSFHSSCRLLVLLLTSVIESLSATVFRPGARSNSTLSTSFLDLTSRADPRAGHDKSFRPHVGGGADIVEYGLYLTSITDVNMKEGTFDADVVITLVWTDIRATVLVPAGQAKVTLAARQAKKRIWVPDVTVTNRYMNAIDTISTAFTITASGQVTKVERLAATLTSTYDITYYPFDSQVLITTLGSATLMSDELQFRVLAAQPGEVVTGVSEGAFNESEFSIVNFTEHVDDEFDGSLHKSRGSLILEVKRHGAPYIQNLIMPEVLIWLVSWTVFWYPLTEPFAMPRVMTALVSFLSLLMLALRTSSVLPIRGTMHWFGLFETHVQTLMFANVCINIFILVVYHQLDRPERAAIIQEEVKWAKPCLAVTLLVVCVWCAWEAQSVEFVTNVTYGLLLLLLIVYLGYQLYQLRDSFLNQDKTGFHADLVPDLCW